MRARAVSSTSLYVMEIAPFSCIFIHCITEKRATQDIQNMNNLATVLEFSATFLPNR
jgi:hypothetical protein